MKILDKFLEDAVLSLDKNDLKRELKNVLGPQGPSIYIEGKEVLNFCSNNYLGLAARDSLKHAAIDCIEEEGVGSSASRLVCGNMAAHQKLEQKIADFKGKEKCLLFSTGYMANVGIISSLFSRDDIIFSDRLNHASIVDGILLSQAKLKRYPHLCMKTLEEMLKREQSGNKKVIITDSVFSMDGDIAPLDKIVELAKKYNCSVMIDEAHALGVMGKNGRGLAEYFDVEKDIDIQMGTLSKAIGCFGAYVVGSSNLVSFLINKARSFVYTTGMPPAIAAAALKSFEIIEEDSSLKTKLWENTRYLQQALKDLGFDTMNSQTPIIPILVKDAKKAVELSKALFKEGIFISAIRPPTVPKDTARLRLTVMATHKKKDLDFLVDKIRKEGKKLCLI
ncbi:MAG: 8-amino-7-oxononanoate synthase [Candidatus Zapsychrus exili]|nr:8-amino-7-oxononanoate synthase [Candidatus Zapsychrus exili]